MFEYIYYKVLKRPHKLKVHSIKRKQGAPLVVFLHGIGNSGAVWSKEIKNLPKNVQYVTLDLLGFGSSRKPNYVDYDLKTHARAVVGTLRSLHFNTNKVILVGHSLGSLIAVDVAKRYPQKINNLILCSPPFYVESSDSRLPSSDDILKNIYEFARDNPNDFMEVANRAKKYHIVTKDFVLNKNNIKAYMDTLKHSIINQSSLRDAINLPQSIKINVIRGFLDPLVLQKNIKILKRLRPSTKVATVMSSHDITNNYIKAIQKDLLQILQNVDAK